MLLDHLPSIDGMNSWRSVHKRRRLEDAVPAETAPCDATANGTSIYEYDPDWFEKLLEQESDDVCIRYLSPRELLRLFGFAPDFTFPDRVSIFMGRKAAESVALTSRKCYELVGNSISVTVCTSLVGLLLSKMTSE